MARQTLESLIVLSGRVDNSFGEIGRRLTLLGSMVDQISGKLTDFGTESVEMYADYDDTLRAIEAKIGNATSADMEKLDKQMREWAANTRYHATDVSNAVKEATTSGWKLDDIYSGIPTTMTLAAAADMDLVQAMEYLNSALAGQGKSLDESARFVDMWVKTANNGRASVEDLGESMEALGSVAMFTDSSEELFTLLNQMSKFGTKGSEAGTLLRNVMLRMIAPTKQAGEALEKLGATEEEIAELEDADLGKAAKRMDEMGLSAFDANGNLKSFLDIVEEIDRATSGMTEQEKYDILTDIFPTRTIRGIMDLLRSTREEYDETMRTILDSEGYAQYVADLQEGGLGGAMRTLESQWEETKLRVGSSLAEWVEPLTDAGIGLLQWVNGMDDAKFEGIVGGLTGIAAAGPGLLIAGQAFRLLGMLGTPTGLAALAIAGVATAIGAVISSVNEINEISLSDSFGTMALDMDELNGYLNSLGGGFRETYGEIDIFSQRAEEAVEAYQKASGQLSGEILTSKLTNTALTEEQRGDLSALGREMVDQVVAGIENAQAAQGTYLEMLFGGEGKAEYNSDYRMLFDVSDQSYQDALAQARSAGEGLQQAVLAAFNADSDEARQQAYDQINGYMDVLNEAMAEAAQRQNSIELKMLLHRAQTAGIDSISEYVDDIHSMIDGFLEKDEIQYERSRATLEEDYDENIAKGNINPETNRPYTKADKEKGLAAFDQKRATQVEATRALYSPTLLELADYLDQSELSDANAVLEQTVSDVLSGKVAPARAKGELAQALGKSTLAGDTVFPWEAGSDRQALGDYYSLLMDAMGGEDAALAQAQYYRSIGDTENAERMARFLTAHNLITHASNRDNDILESLSDDIQKMENYSNALYGYQGTLALAPNLSMPQTQTTASPPGISVNPIFGVTNYNGTLIMGTEADRAKTIAEYEALHASVNVENPDAATEEALGVMQGAMDDSPLNATVEVPNGYDAAMAYANSAQAALNANPGRYNVIVTQSGGQALRQTTNKLSMYAEGGRADEPSVFGEAGPEWAIPEAHTSRVAQLFDMARQASGFTWGELQAATGNGAAAAVSTQQLIYAPTIIANDASGVEEKLAEDKRRLEKWWREKQLIEGRLSYT